jgi:antitoxin MazE
MRSKIVRIGNSMGIRIPKSVLRASGLGQTVDLEPTRKGLLVRRAHQAREGWEDAFRRMASAGDDRLLDRPAMTRWDHAERRW